MFSEALRKQIFYDFEWFFVPFQKGFLRRIEACMREASVLKNIENTLGFLYDSR